MLACIEHIKEDLFTYLKKTEKPILLYGMGNGGDKILSVCAEKGIPISGVFASDGFVRGHFFHGMPVESYKDKVAKYGKGNFIVLLSFASSLPNVIAHIREIERETELYAPDLPVVSEWDDAPEKNRISQPLFDLDYCTRHEEELSKVRALLSDSESKEIFDSVIRYRLTGKIDNLYLHESKKEEVYTSLLPSIQFRTYADLGAYNGDTVRELLSYAPHLQTAFCLEPDPRTFRKLSEYAEQETGTTVIPLNYAAYSERATMGFEGSANRNSTLTVGTTKKPKQPVECDTLTSLLAPYAVQKLDYVKLDVEGAERAALEGAMPLLLRDKPYLLVSLYHRREDLFSLPLFLRDALPGYRFYLRRFPYLPAWDLNLYLVPEDRG